MAKRAIIDVTAVPPCWELLQAIAPGCPGPLLMYGPSGTGKTHYSIHGLARQCDDQRVYVVTLSEETPAAEIRGHWLPKGDGFVWHDGPGVAAMRAGGRLVLNEIDHASEDCTTLLHVLCESPTTARLTLPSGETVTPAPGFHVIASMNGTPEDLRLALRDRFTVRVNIDAPHPGAVASLPEDLQRVALATCVTEDPQRAVSMRAWLAYADLRGKVGADMAARAIFGPRAQDVLDALKLGERPTEE